MELTFITSNEGKFREAEQIAAKYGISLKWKKMSYLEPQGSSLEEIASLSAEMLSKELKETFFIEDSGLFIEALKGFPGPYSSYVFKTIGNEGILRLMDGVEDRRAYFLAVIAYFDGSEVQTFTGRVDGEISTEMRGSGGFGFDPIFLYNGRTFAEMGEEKNAVSHRRRALEGFFTCLSDR
ncbi:XTP/dITP diphosphatase [Archaeoglobus veneficus]|uniref:dITP/XTP pyrophosphatase n=1 Tax=Archaeoglobus veneficus (strain DSM 11195 / SNP6) TaxID=693661 RepID=F2KNA4_ARCVS|nr:XTP/dITP diphosphatase [Archaeoglobus veneficus]AEA46205.1 non-canonical purine NTP pyrophosphatase, rdgB/HAM1 family [Archaeoglobus veneficus SNP6]